MPQWKKKKASVNERTTAQNHAIFLLSRRVSRLYDEKQRSPWSLNVAARIRWQPIYFCWSQIKSFICEQQLSYKNNTK